MRVVDVPPTVVPGARDLEHALRVVFGPATLRRVHGPDVVVGDFAGNRRAFDFFVDVGAVPAAIRRFFCGTRMRVTTRQTLCKKAPAAWTVVNKLKMHFVGAELFGIRPRFVLARDPSDGAVRLGGRVEHYALLPPPLNGIAEAFMAATTREQLDAYADAVRSASASSASSASSSA